MLVDITTYLNTVIKKTGKAIEINNKVLWDNYFHKWSNDDWDLMLTALEELQRVQPHLFEHYHNRSIEQARNAWMTQKSATDRVLDSKRHKGKAWACVMTIREVINKVLDLHVPNEDRTVIERTEPQPTLFGQLFTN